MFDTSKKTYAAPLCEWLMAESQNVLCGSDDFTGDGSLDDYDYRKIDW